MALRWSDTLTPTLRVLPDRIDNEIGRHVRDAARQGERSAKRNAPWTNRTGRARAGLFAVSGVIPGSRYRIILSHTMYYGIWLEIANQKRFAIILKTLHRTGEDLMARLHLLLAKMRG